MDLKQVIRVLRRHATKNQGAIVLCRAESGKLAIYFRTARASMRIQTELNRGNDLPVWCRASDLASNLEADAPIVDSAASLFQKDLVPFASPALPEIGWLAGSLGMVSHAMSKDADNDSLYQVEITSGPDEVTGTPVVYACAMDGHRMAIVMTDVDAWPTVDRSQALLISAPIVRHILAMRAPCAMDIVDGVLWLSCGGLTIRHDHGDAATFPDWREIANGPEGATTNANVAFLDRRELMRTVDKARASLRDEVARDGDMPRELLTSIGLTDARACVSVLHRQRQGAATCYQSTAIKAERFRYVNETEQKTDARPLAIVAGIDLAYLADALASLRADHVGITIGAIDGPVTVSDGDQMLVIMPLKLTESELALSRPPKLEPVKRKARGKVPTVVAV